MIKKVFDIKQNLEKLRESGIQKGESTGFKSLDKYHSVKQGYYTIIQGAPTHGKSELIFELILNQAIKYGKKAIILSPETGNSNEIAMELIHKFLGKTAYKTNKYHCTDVEFEQAVNFIDYHFSIVDDEDVAYSLKDLEKLISDFEKVTNTKFDIVMAEPWNELNHKLALNDNSGRQDLAIEDELTELRKYCKRTNKHTFLSFHPAYQQLKQGDGFSYYDMPRAREAAGGQATLRKAFCWLNIWRPHQNIINRETGMFYGSNDLVIQIEKSKPKGVGQKGELILHFDWQKSRYYEVIDGQKLYAFEHEKNFYPIENRLNNITENAPF